MAFDVGIIFFSFWFPNRYRAEGEGNLDSFPRFNTWVGFNFTQGSLIILTLFSNFTVSNLNLGMLIDFNIQDRRGH